jgi:DNA-binding HxlR family transcriptional regulator
MLPPCRNGVHSSRHRAAGSHKFNKTLEETGSRNQSRASFSLGEYPSSVLAPADRMKNPNLMKNQDNGTAGEDACDGEQPYLPFIEAMRPLTGKWKIEIMWALAHKTHRFGELRRALPGITQHMLAQQLRDLETDGLVKRTAHAVVPPRVEYEATEAAYGLKPVFKAFIAWSEQYGPIARRQKAWEEKTMPESWQAAPPA